MQRSPAVSRCAPFGAIHMQEHVVLCRWGTCRKCVLGGVGGAAMGSGGGGRGSNGEWWWWEGQQWEVVVVGGAAMGDGGRGSNGMAENGCTLQKG